MNFLSGGMMAVICLGMRFIYGEVFEREMVRAYLVDGENRLPWALNSHQLLSRRRAKRDADGGAIRIRLDRGSSVWDLQLKPKSHPVTPDTIVEWVQEDGDRTLTRGIRTDHCWFSGSVEHEKDSVVSLGVCDGLSGLIHSNNRTLLLEPLRSENDTVSMIHIIYPLPPSLDLNGDEDFGMAGRVKRASEPQVDYDEEGNEITNTVDVEEAVDYGQRLDGEDEESNTIDDEDDEAVIFDTYTEIDDYDVHPPATVIEANSLQEAEEKERNSSKSRTPNGVDENRSDIDGFSVDKLWEGEHQQAAKRKKPISKTSAGQDAMKFLEMALAVDHTVIKFHGKQRVQQYVLTLLNIVSAIYEDNSLEANLRLVVSRLVFYEDRKQGQVREGNSKRSLENVNAWNAGLLRNGAADNPHDVAVWLTRYELGGPSGYAPVAGVCDPDRSCSLNRDEGLTSAFIIAHEVGHVLGFSHDGDESAGNDCSDEALQGSVMAPMVAATFSRFHWSRCTHWEYHFKQHNWRCLKNAPNPNNTNGTLLQSAIQYSYSLDEQCRMEFGEGYMLCRSFALSDPCTHLWCGHKSSPQLCKTKKGPPLEGTPCGKDKWCIKGFCEAIGKRKKMVGPVVNNPRDGQWGAWAEWNTCSRTCGIGVRFRTRKCNNPAPSNGGKVCQGKSEESELCNTQPCTEWTDFRAEQCAIIPLFLSVNASSLTWLPWEGINQSLQCRLTCVAQETGELFQGTDSVVDGTFCSYENPHGICIQGQCQSMGCDKRLGSPARENECGVCNGKAGDCTVASRHYSGAPRPPHRRVVVIPRGARNIRIKEEPNTSNRLALKGRNSHSWILNGTFPVLQDVFTDHFIAAGTRFTYHSVFGLETMRAQGPLLSDLTLMIIPGAARESANVTVTWNTPPKVHRKKNPGPEASPGQLFWELAGWSVCSRSCGGGTQSQVWYCRDRLQADQQTVLKRRHCAHLQEPQILTRLCNTFSCDFRWVTGPWEGCSQTCGSDGVQQRMIYCVRTAMVSISTIASPNNTTAVTQPEIDDFKRSHQMATAHEARRSPEVVDDTDRLNTSFKDLADLSASPTVETWKPTIKDHKKKLAVENEVLTWNSNAIADPRLCRDQVPVEFQPCNRNPCPGTWQEKGWTKCSASCGAGQQDMQFICASRNAKPDYKELATGYVHPTEGHEVDALNSTAYGVAPHKTEPIAVGGRHHWRNLVCGTKPELSRPCMAAQQCPVVAPSDCSDESAHCQISILQRYCVVPSYRQSCCQACANFLTL